MIFLMFSWEEKVNWFAWVSLILEAKFTDDAYAIKEYLPLKYNGSFNSSRFFTTEFYRNAIIAIAITSFLKSKNYFYTLVFCIKVILKC